MLVSHGQVPGVPGVPGTWQLELDLELELELDPVMELTFVSGGEHRLLVSLGRQLGT